MSSDFLIGVLATLTGALIIKLASKYAKSVAAKKIVDLKNEKETLNKLNDSFELTMKHSHLLVFASFIAFGAAAANQFISSFFQIPWLIYSMNVMSLGCCILGISFSYIGFERMVNLRDYDSAINKIDAKIKKLNNK